MRAPLQVGITGGIGSGKSVVCKIFQHLGIPVYDADSRAKNLMTTDGILVEQIKKEFGNLAYLPDGGPDRAYLSQQVFGNPERLRALNGLVHPRVALDYANWVDGHGEFPYLIREAALLYEAGIAPKLGPIIVVIAPEDLRIQRVQARDPHRTVEEIRKIIGSQMPDEEKMKRADHILLNDDQHLVIPQVLRLHHLFLTNR
ncbi:MAG: dephospho-CoA kinase [Cyclobacteriaceae bacterium]|nr:dephospho-CoA kinase [Cyclobacteriaceae bacterium]